MSKCIDPVLCYDQGTSRKFRHYSLSSPLFKALHNRVFNCGKCIFCRKRRSAELALRCVLHASLYERNCFLTLTYDESRPGYHNRFEYSDIQTFKKRLRSYVSYHFGQKVQVFNVHEYGANGKKHWHLVVFGFDFQDKVLHTVKNGNRLYKSKKLEELWPHGFGSIGDVTEASAMYQAQYTQKDFKYGHASNDKKSHSKHSGIGKEYFLKNYSQILRLGYIPFNGRKAPIPRYFLRLAHKHYSHFFEPVNFVDTKERKRLYTPFKPGLADRNIADLFVKFREMRQDFLKQISEEWEKEVFADLFSKEEKDFQKSGANYIHDLKNKNNFSEF